MSQVLVPMGSGLSDLLEGLVFLLALLNLEVPLPHPKLLSTSGDKSLYLNCCWG
jgi:hypothetical protein